MVESNRMWDEDNADLEYTPRDVPPPPVRIRNTPDIAAFLSRKEEEGGYSFPHPGGEEVFNLLPLLGQHLSTLHHWVLEQPQK